MLEFDAAWAQQDDLPGLTAPQTGPALEIYLPNENYGFGMVLKAYSEYPPEKPICAIIPHGVYVSMGLKPSPQETGTPLRMSLSYPAYADGAWRRAGMHPIACASPFLYALELMREAEILHEPQERSGTLFLPSHSTAMVSTRTDMTQVAQMLENLPPEMLPVTVCMHWYDYSQGMADEYESLGYRVVSAGHFMNQAFTLRLIHLMTPFRYAISNSLGSSLFYATALGLDARLMGSVEHEFDPAFERAEPSEESAERVERLTRVFAQGSLEERMAETDYHLRRDALQGPDGLLGDLLYAEREFLASR